MAATPESGRVLDTEAIAELLRGAGRVRNIRTRAETIVAALRHDQLEQPPVLADAYGASVRSLTAVITELTRQTEELETEVSRCFGRHPDAEIYRSQPGLGEVLGARALAEFGDAPDRYTSAKARKNYAGTSPITRASGKKTVIAARFARNRRLADMCYLQAFAALNASPGARAYYDSLRARGAGHHDALRRLGNRLVGILHGCLKTGTPYDEATAWPPSNHAAPTAA